MPPFRPRALYALVALLLASPLLSAQEDASPTLIEVREILPSDQARTPGAAARLTAEDLALLRPYSLHDAFSFVPGLRTIDDDVLGRRAGIGVRGAPSRRSRKTLMLEDGTPINFSSYLDPSTHYTPPMERLESIDVLKGSGHLQHGPLNNHGIVNFRNKRPTEVPETVVELSAGNLDTLRRHVMHRRSDGALGLVLSYTGMDAAGSFDVEDFRYDDFYASALWDLSERQSLGLSLTHFRERSHYDESNLTPQEYAVAPRRKLGRFGQEFNTFALDYTKADLVHDLEFDSGLGLSTRLFAIEADRPRFTVEPEEIEVDALPAIELEDEDALFIPGVQGEMISRDRRYRTFGIDSRLSLPELALGEQGHALEIGLRAERHLLNDMRSAGEAGEILHEGNRGLRTRDEVYQASAFSAFVEDSISLAPDLRLNAGLRAEYYTQNKRRRGLPTDPGPHDPLETEHTFLLLPSVSLLYDGLADTQVFANLGRGYTPAFARTADSFPLEAETGINSQVGVRRLLEPGLRVEAAVFYNHINDTIVQLPYSVNDMNVVLNSADSRSWGFDLGLRLDTAEAIPSVWNGFLELAANYTRAEFREDHLGSGLKGNAVPEVPRLAGSLSVGMEHASGWHASLTVSHFGDFYTDPLNTVGFTLADEDREPVGPGDSLEIREPAVLGRVPSHTLLSARVSWTPPGSGLSLWLQGRNLGDKLYITDLENGIRPGAERTLVAGMRYSF